MRFLSLEKTYWSRVLITNDCWLWTGRRGGPLNNQYGKVIIGNRPQRKAIGAHRLAWILANKMDIPVGMEVCHTCDVKLCVRPDHLFLGTQEDNMKDMARKGRAAQGINHWNYKHGRKCKVAA